MTVQSLIHKACSCIEKGDYSRAVQHFEKAVGFDPNNSELYAYLGEAYFLHGQYDEAKIAFDRRDELVLQNDPLSPYVTGYRGCIMLNCGEIDRARSMLEESYAKQAKDPELLYHLGILRMLQGSREDSRHFLRKIDALDPSFYYRKIETLIKRL